MSSVRPNRVLSSSMTFDSRRAIEPSQPSASMSKAPRPARPKTRSRSCEGRRGRWGTGCPCRPPSGGELRATGRAVRRHDELALGAVAQRHDGPEDLRDDVAGLAQHHGVADQHALALDLVGVVQRGHLHGGSGHHDGLHDTERGDPTRAADVDLDVEEPGVDLLRRVLVGDRPPRRPRGRAELALDRGLVDLDDDAVDLVLDAVAVLAVVGDELLHLVDGGEHAVVRGDGQAPLRQQLVGLGLPGQLEALAVADAVHQHVQRPGGRDAGVLLAQGSRGGVAGVGERRLAGLDERGVEVGERLDREVDLAADLHPGRVVGAGEPVRDVLDRLDVVGDVLAGAAVAAGERPHQAAVLVEQVDGEAVDLQLAEVVEVGAVGVARDARRPGGQLLGAEAVVEAQHPLEVVDGTEVGREDRPADLLGRAVRCPQGGVGLLELAQPPDDRVVLGIADGRRVLDVVVELRLGRLLGEVDPLVVLVRGTSLTISVTGPSCRTAPTAALPRGTRMWALP